MTNYERFDDQHQHQQSPPPPPSITPTDPSISDPHYSMNSQYSNDGIHSSPYQHQHQNVHNNNSVPPHDASSPPPGSWEQTSMPPTEVVARDGRLRICGCMPYKDHHLRSDNNYVTIEERPLSFFEYFLSRSVLRIDRHHVSSAKVSKLPADMFRILHLIHISFGLHLPWVLLWVIIGAFVNPASLGIMAVIWLVAGLVTFLIVLVLYFLLRPLALILRTIDFETHYCVIGRGQFSPEEHYRLTEELLVRHRL
eukprot:gb/GECH01014360.1/.p1 GENE.gb/GECH01014360.1/~~gb/GECH01014360.1/.p1  ORF type:complete len:253 (+),score=40.28 gb/GECH01014360.1/:1-759(+)